MDSIDSFISQKNANSPYLTLDDGESARVKVVKNIKQVSKIGYGGDEVECLRVMCVVETEFGDKDKNFDNSSAKFAKELKAHNISVGSSFTITREGEGPKTTYVISDVVNKESTANAAAPQGKADDSKPFIDPKEVEATNQKAAADMEITAADIPL